MEKKLTILATGKSEILTEKSISESTTQDMKLTFFCEYGQILSFL